MRAIVALAAVVIVCPVGAEADTGFLRAGVGVTYLDVRPGYFERYRGVGPALDLTAGLRRPSGWVFFADLTIDVALITSAPDRNPVDAMELIGPGAGVGWRSPGGWSLASTLRVATLAIQYASPPSGSRDAFGFDLRVGRQLLGTGAWLIGMELRAGLAWLTPASDGSGGYWTLPSIALGMVAER